MIKYVRYVLPLVLTALLLPGVAGCAKSQVPLQTVQVTHTGLALAQDLEAQICWGVATAKDAVPDRTVCPGGKVIGLTDAAHQAFNAKLATAFTLHKAATAQIDAGILNADLSSLNGVIAEILTLVAQWQTTPTVAQIAAAIKAGGIVK